MTNEEKIAQMKRKYYVEPQSRIYEKDIGQYLIKTYDCINLSVTPVKNKYFEAICFLSGKQINFRISYTLTATTMDADGNDVLDEYLKSFEFRFDQNINLKDLSTLLNLLGYEHVDYIFEKTYNEISFFYRNITFNNTLYFKNNGKLRSFSPFSNFSILTDDSDFLSDDDQADLLVSYYLFNVPVGSGILALPIPCINIDKINQIGTFLDDYRLYKDMYFKILEINMY